MIPVEEALLDSITATFHHLRTGKVPPPIVIPDDVPDNELRQLITYLNRFLTEFAPFAEAMEQIARGDLETHALLGRMPVIQSLKALHSNLRHLTWKTQQIAAGDLEQRVDFMGDFSTAFNKMTQQLKDSYEALVQLNKELERRNEFIRKTFGRYTSAVIVETLLDMPDGLKLGGEKREVTILMSDLRGFAALAERLEPTEVDALLNHYLSAMVEPIQKSGGRENDLVMERVSRDTQKVADYIASIFAQAGSLEADVFWPYEKHMYALEEGQFANPKGDISSVFVPNLTEINERVTREVELSAYLDLIFDSIFRGNPNVQAIYFATPRDVVRYYPNIDLGSVLPPDFRATQRIWYTGSTNQGNPEGKAWWTPVYLDATGLGLVTTAALSVYGPSKEMLGVIGMDISLAEMMESIETDQPLQGGYTLLIENSGKAIALPSQGYKHILGRELQPGEVAPDLTKTPNRFFAHHNGYDGG